MPYVRQLEREEIDKLLNEMIKSIGHCGQMNYAITKLIHLYLQGLGLKYARINEVIGILECAKLELYRQIAAPYEDVKKRENGSVSTLDSSSLEDVR